MNIAILSGDGIGPEVMNEAIKILDEISDRFGHEFTFTEGLIGGAAFDQYQNHFPEDTKNICKQADAILFGSVGGPVDQQDQLKWKNAEKNAILGFRKEFNLNINLRPAKVYPELSDLSPLKSSITELGVDILVVRELLHGIYFGEHTTEGTTAIDTMQYTEDQVKPIIEFACYSASERKKKVTVVDKANVLDCSRLWRKVAREVGANHPDIEIDFMYIDNAIMQVIKNPSQFDVVATSNLFGDIFSDATSVLPGSLGLMPSASLGGSVHMYEPIGGSAPDIAGKGVANPIAQILSAAMMLRFTFDLEEEAAIIEDAVSTVLRNGRRTGDLGGGSNSISTAKMGDYIAKEIRNNK